MTILHAVTNITIDLNIVTLMLKIMNSLEHGKIMVKMHCVHRLLVGKHK